MSLASAQWIGAGSIALFSALFAGTFALLVAAMVMVLVPFAVFAVPKRRGKHTTVS